MDEPGLLAPEWERKQVVPALQRYFDDIWVYGLPQICDPLEGIELPKSVRKRMTYTGYLKRSLPKLKPHVVLEKIEDPFLLVTVGGGGDGEAIIDWVLRAYESDPKLPYPALLVLGPFMNSENQADFMARAAQLPNVEAVTFETHLESLMDRALGVVCMGGYTSAGAVLSFDKRAFVIRRTERRLEQTIGAWRPQDLGLVRMLRDDGRRDPTQMATALRNLPQQRKPSEVVVPGLLDGPANVVRLADYWLKHGSSRLTVAGSNKGRR